MQLDIVSARRALLARDVTASELVEGCLATIAEADAEARKIFVHVDADGARQSATLADALYEQGRGEEFPLLGIPISVKDLFHLAGQVSTAGSAALQNNVPAAADATAVTRLRAAGAVIIGRTNMSELAFSGVGVNPHYGTPANPKTTGLPRITGGSSSGAAASVARGMALAGIGSDTGGSVRIPAALCGLTGYKPTQALIPLDGTIPLSHSLDSIGPIAVSVADCALLADVMAGRVPHLLAPAALAGVRLIAPQNYILDGASGEVMNAFRESLDLLRQHGAEIDETPFPELSGIPEMMKEATFPAYEGYRHHRDLVLSLPDALDPLVLSRFQAGGLMTDAGYARLVEARTAFIAAVTSRLGGYDALIMPTVPIVAPEIDALADAAAFHTANLLLLRNPTVINLLDGCAVSLPNTRPGSLPTGLSIAGLSGQDDRILALACAIERLT